MRVTALGQDIRKHCCPQLPKALGCDDWFTVRVRTCGEFDQALKTASEGGRGVYIEVVTDKYAAPPVALSFTKM